jgi:hypothetical protein
MCHQPDTASIKECGDFDASLKMGSRQELASMMASSIYTLQRNLRISMTLPLPINFTQPKPM